MSWNIGSWVENVGQKANQESQFQQQSAGRAWGLEQSIAASQAQAAPQFALNQNSRSQLMNQMGLGAAGANLDTRGLTENYNNQVAGFGLQDQARGVDRNALNRQSGNFTSLFNLGIQGNNQNRLDLNRGANTARIKTKGASAARGAISSPGTRMDISNINDDLASQLLGVNLGEQKQRVQYNENLAMNRDQLAHLDLQAQQLGLSRQKLSNELKTGLERIGLNNQLSQAQLMEKMTSSSIQDQVLAQQVFNAAIQNSDYYSQFYTPGQSQSQSQGPSASRRGPQ